MRNQTPSWSQSAKTAFWVFSLVLALAFSAHAAIDSDAVYEPVEPTADQSRANILIARQLQFGHFKDKSVDGDVGARALDSYLEQLDNQRLYFTQEDVEEFQSEKDDMERALKAGRLETPFRIYNRFQQRTIERLEYVLGLLEDGVEQFDLDGEGEYLIDRSEADWPEDKEALDQVWKDRIRNAVVGMKLDDQSDEEVAQALKRRYEGQLKRAYEPRSEDAFQSWMNAFTRLWDPHTQYMSPRSSENFDINMSLSLEGIGAVLQSEDGYTKVSRIVPGGPAAREGQLGPADRIIGVAQEDEDSMVNVIGWRLDEVVDLIRGPKESRVRLEVIPASAPNDMATREIEIQRDEVQLEDQSAQSTMMEKERDGQPWNVGVIDIPTFYADLEAARSGDEDYRSTTRDVRGLIEDLKKDGMDGLVIDLRNNGGGALSEANQLVSLFVEAGPTVQVRGADGSVQVFRDDDDGVVWDGPVIVLVNGLSASASEIFAGAMQDYGRAVVMGSQTFGKGTVQAVRPLNHGQLKITQSKFYRISGASTQNRGVVPDIEIPSRIRQDRIGESALDDAMAWDEIDPVDHRTYFDFSEVLGGVTEKHRARFSEVPEYQLLLREIELMEEQQDRTHVSLNKAERQAQQDDFRARQLEIANERRELRGDEPFEDWKAFQEDAESNRAMARRSSLSEDGPDFVVHESSQVLADILSMNSQYTSIFQNGTKSESIARED